MTKFITLLIGFSLAFAAVAQAKRAEQENPKNKKSNPVQQKQVAPKAPTARAEQPRNLKSKPVQQQQLAPKPQRPVPTDDGPKGPMKESMETMKKAHKDPAVQPNTLPAVQSNKLNKTVKTFQPRHRDFQAKVNPSVASVRFNQDFRIRNAENWRGAPLQRLPNLSPPMARPGLVAFTS